MGHLKQSAACKVDEWDTFFGGGEAGLLQSRRQHRVWRGGTGTKLGLSRVCGGRGSDQPPAFPEWRVGIWRPLPRCPFVLCLSQAWQLDMEALRGRHRSCSPARRRPCRTVAHHEAGCAVVGWVLGCADPLPRVGLSARSLQAWAFALPRWLCVACGYAGTVRVTVAALSLVEELI